MALAQRVGRSRHRLILLVLTAITLLTLDLQSFGPLGTVQRTIRDVLHPITEVAGAVASPFANAWRGVFELDDLKATNAALQAELDEAAGLRLEVEAERAAFERLLEATAITYLDDVDSVTATVVRGAVGNFDSDVLTIDKGSNSGIRSGMAVVTGAGLVGRVDRVDQRTATVQLLSDPDLLVGVRLVGTDEVGLGSADASNGQTFVVSQGLEWPDDGDEALLPALGTGVVTAAASRYPAEIPVGTVSNVRSVDEGLGMEVAVEVSANLSDLGFVTVLLSEGIDEVPLDVVTPSTLAPPTTSTEAVESEP